jgi:hypothetical protein
VLEGQGALVELTAKGLDMTRRAKVIAGKSAPSPEPPPG